MPDNVCGLWLRCRDRNVILVRADGLDAAQQRHVFLHELAHVAFDHGRDVSMTDLATWLGADCGIDLSAVVTARGGVSGYQAPQEYEAEQVARHLGRTIRLSGPRRDDMLRDF